MITNVRTPEGRRYCAAWRRVNGDACMVMGLTLDETLRKVILCEEELDSL